MADQSEKVLVGRTELAEAKRLSSLLKLRGVAIEMASPAEADCTTKSCSTQVDLFVSPNDVEKFKELLTQERHKILSGLDVDAGRIDQVYDSEKASAQCPACGTEFSTSLTECPDCGLGFAVG